MIIWRQTLLISIVVSVIVVSPSLWLKARFLDAVMLGSVFRFFFTGLLTAIVQLVIWLGLVKHFFDASWGQSLIISIVAVVIFLVVSVILGALLGLAVFALPT